MKKLFIILVLASTSIYLKAQTEVGGAILEDSSQTIAESPYLITENLIIFEDVTLTIDPGVEVLVAKDIVIEVRNGNLIAKGTETDTIKIRSELRDTNKWHWRGFIVKGLININGATTQIDMSHCVLSNARLLLDMDDAHYPTVFNNVLFQHNNRVSYDISPNTTTRFNNCTFANNNEGLIASDKTYIDNCHFENNKIGAKFGRYTNCTFTGNTELGVYVYISLVNCEVWNNAVGVRSDNHANTTVADNYIHNNEIGVSISRFWNENDIVFANNLICDNTLWNIDYHYENAADLTKNCWCLDNEDSIKATIRDAFEDTKLGVISVDPTYNDSNRSLTVAFNYSNTTVSDSIIRFVDTSNNNEIVSWSWDFGDGETSTEQSPSHKYNESGEYEVCLTCANTRGSKTVCENISVMLVLDVAAATATKTKIYPQPANDVLLFNQPSMQNCEYKIYNNLGELKQAGETTGQIAIETLNKGIYLLMLQSGNKVLNQKIMVN